MATLAAPTTPAGNSGGGQTAKEPKGKGKGKSSTTNTGNSTAKPGANNNTNQQPKEKETTKPPHPNQVQVGGGLNKGELDNFLAIERRQLRHQQLDKEGGWPEPSGNGPQLFSEEETAEIKKLQANLTALRALPEDTRDEDAISKMQAKLDTVYGKKPTATGGEKEAAKLSHYLGKIRSTYAATTESCNKEVDAAKVALQAATERLQKAEEAVVANDKDYNLRRARVQKVLDQCSCSPVEESSEAHPTTTAQGETLQYHLPVDVLATKLSAEVNKIKEQYGLQGHSTVQMEAVDAFCTRLLTTELSAGLTDHVNLHHQLMEQDTIGELGQQDVYTAWAAPVGEDEDEECGMVDDLDDPDLPPW